jgi:hypothetical protein
LFVQFSDSKLLTWILLLELFLINVVASGVAYPFDMRYSVLGSDGWLGLLLEGAGQEIGQILIAKKSPFVCQALLRTPSITSTVLL